MNFGDVIGKLRSTLSSSSSRFAPGQVLFNVTLVKFALTGLSGVFVNLGSFQVLLALGVHRLLASPIAIELSIISNFLINDYWTFRDRSVIDRKRVRGIKFHLVSLGTLVLSYGTFILLSALFPSAYPVFLQGCGIVPAVLFNYAINSRWTFRDSPRKVSGPPARV